MTTIPIATGERKFTTFEYREVLEKQAATVLQPDVCSRRRYFAGDENCSNGRKLLLLSCPSQSIGTAGFGSVLTD
ncbi:MAG: hypothetical protein ACLUTU_17045 [Blautia faecis]